MIDLFFSDIKELISKNFVNHGWVNVFSFEKQFKDIEQGGLYSAIVDTDKALESLKHYTWDLRFGNGKPGFATYYENNQEITEYYRYSSDGIEPLIYYREFYGSRENYLELSEEFRLFYNLYEITLDNMKKEYLYLDSNGDEEVVCVIERNFAQVKLKFIKDYISARNKFFLIYFDFMRFSEKSISELKIKEIDKNYSSPLYFYNHIIRDTTQLLPDKKKVQSWLMGKTLIKSIENYKPNILGTIEDRNDFAEFIISYDENGKEILYTCDEEKLGNYFGKNPDAPQYVTPVYFSRDVLKKYYDNPSKYSVTDGHISCTSVWGLRLDNSIKDYVIVLLGDLGKLSYKEQLYWKSFNIAPRKEGFSYTAYKRFFKGEPADPDSSDLYFKMKFSEFNRNWLKKFKWYLFKPLSGKDSHYYISLHLLTSKDNIKEFEEQILALTKILIDSLNDKELIKRCTLVSENMKSIDKLECYLKSYSLNFPEMITFLKNLQSLRSTSIAHRKSEKKKETMKTLVYFNFDKRNLQEILDGIFIEVIKTLNTLEKLVLLNDIIN